MGIGFVIVAAAIAYLLHGEGAEDARRRWEARVEALRAAGEPVDPDDFRPDPVPDADNAEGLLREVHEAYAAAWPEWPGPADYPFELETGEFSEEELEDLAAWWPRLEPLYVRLEEASTRPLLVDTWQDPLVTRITPWIADADRLRTVRAEYRPEDAESMAAQSLRTALAWRPRNHVEVFVRWGQFVSAVRILRRAAASGTVDLSANGPAFRELLRWAESGWLEEFRLAHHAARATVILEVACSTGGQNPPEETQELYDCEKPSEASALEELYLEALAKLDHLDAQLAGVRSEEDLRSAPVSDGPLGSDRASYFLTRGAVMRMLAAVRLARWALLLEEERAAGRALSDDLVVYADRFPAGPPLDPATGRPFRWKRRESDHVLSIDAEAADPEHFRLIPLAELPNSDDLLAEQELAWIFADV